MVKANGLLVVLDVDFIKSLVDIVMELLHKDDKMGRLTALGRAPEPEATESCSLESKEIVHSEPPPSSEQTVQRKDTFKFQASLQNFRVAIVEDATKSNPTALLLRVCAHTCRLVSRSRPDVDIHICVSFACTCMTDMQACILCSMFCIASDVCRQRHLLIYCLIHKRTVYELPFNCPTLVCPLALSWKWTIQ